MEGFFRLDVNPRSERKALRLPKIRYVCRASRCPFVSHCEDSRFEGAHTILLGVDCPTALQVGTCGTLGSCMDGAATSHASYNTVAVPLKGDSALHRKRQHRLNLFQPLWTCGQREQKIYMWECTVAVVVFAGPQSSALREAASLLMRIYCFTSNVKQRLA